jgi:hypothetical protein
VCSLAAAQECGLSECDSVNVDVNANVNVNERTGGSNDQVSNEGHNSRHGFGLRGQQKAGEGSASPPDRPSISGWPYPAMSAPVRLACGWRQVNVHRPRVDVCLLLVLRGAKSLAPRCSVALPCSNQAEGRCAPPVACSTFSSTEH